MKGATLIKRSKRGRFHKKLNRNLNRRNRRKNSKLRYYKILKSIRNKRQVEELNTSILEFGITDMEYTTNYNTVLTEVNEWHTFEQIAYWKSRAMALELENKMLHQHLRSVYAKQIQDYAQWTETAKSTNSTINKINENNNEKCFNQDPENVEMLKKRKSEMKKLYGDKVERIMGMETAVQLNYELNSEDGSVPYWPQLPLNLKFN